MPVPASAVSPALLYCDSKSSVHVIGIAAGVPAVPRSTTDMALHACHASVPPHGGVEVPVHAFQVPRLPLGVMSIPVCAHVLSQH